MKYKKILTILPLLILVLFPILSFAQANGTTPISVGTNVTFSNSSTTLLCALKQPNPKIGDLLGYGTCIIGRSVIPLIFALAMAMFVWGVVQYVINNDEEAKKAKGKQFMIWGIVGLAVMLSVWGLVSILGNTFGLGAQNFIPQVSTPGQ